MNRCCVHDFTSSCETGPNWDTCIAWLKENSKRWCFQKERGASGYTHFQGRFSLISKQKMRDIIHPFSHLSVTSKENYLNMFYVLKDDTRVDGPWQDTDVYVPKSCKDTALLPFQKHIVEHRDDDRTINCIIDPKGGKGKTHVCRYIDATKRGVLITFTKDYKDLMRCVFNQDPSLLYLVDIPRGMKKDKLDELFAALETLKDGLSFDDRYKYRKRWMEPPTIWVFTNTIPNLRWLSSDRWKLWSICPSTNVLLPKVVLGTENTQVLPSTSSQEGFSGGSSSTPCNTSINRFTLNTLEKPGLVGRELDSVRNSSIRLDDVPIDNIEDDYFDLEST